MNELRKGLPELPPRFKKLPVDHRGYPVPWFVTWIDGKPDFRIADGSKRVRAVRERLCWQCGEPLGKFLAFVIGPMCAVNRVTSEPASHRECAEFAVRACPFMTRPHAQQRTANLPTEGGNPGGVSLGGNPGAQVIWITTTFRPFNTPPEGWLISVGDPVETLWYCEGRRATRPEILSSFDARLPLLASIAKQQSPEAEQALLRQVAAAMRLVPA